MTSRYDEAIKEQIRSRADIAAVIGRYVNLKGSGQILKGLCPFHKEKTPSFQVNPVKGFFYCFGCRKGGDVFTFLQEIEGVAFFDALKMLAEETGVELKSFDEHRPAQNVAGTQVSKSEMLRIHDIAARFFYQSIRQSSQAIDYFKSRGLAPETVRDFRLGYSPPGYSSLIMHFQNQGIDTSTLVSCGLVIKNEDGKTYDRFRNRVMFSLFDLSGKVIGFAGRAMEADATPKYLNSPETLLYKKKSVLYGLYQARQYIKENGLVLVVEGYMDYLTMYQAGVRNVVASSGTALTEEHAQLLIRFCSRVVLLFDGDSAGQAAATRAIYVLAPFNFDISVLVLPGDEDPDSYIKKYGKQSFLEQIKSSKDWMHFIIDKMIIEHDGRTSRGKSAVIAALNPLIQSIKDTIVQHKFKKEIAERLDLDERLVYNRINSLKSNSVKEPLPEYGVTPPGSQFRSGNAGDGKQFSRSGQDGLRQKPNDDERFIGSLEGSFLRILVTKPEFIAEARQYVVPETLTDNIASDIYSLLIKTHEQGGDVAQIAVEASDPEIKRIISLLLVRPALEDHIHDELVQKIVHLRAKFIKSMIRKIKIQMKNVPQKRAELLLQLKDFTSQLQELDGVE